MWRYFPRVSKTHNKKVVKETPRKVDAGDYAKMRSRGRGGQGGSCLHCQNDDGIGDDDKGGVRL